MSGKSAVFPLTLGLTALCRRLAFYLFKGEMLYSGQWHNGDAGDFPFRRPREAEKDTRRKANSPPVLPAGCFYLEQFQFEVRSISNHTACRFAEKAQFFRSLWAGRRCAAASRFTHFKGETL